MKKHIIFVILNILLVSTTVFSKDSYVKYCKAEIFLTDQISVEDIESLEMAPGSQVELLDSPARAIAEITQADAGVLIDAGVKLNILNKFVLYSVQTNINELMTTEAEVSPVLTTTTGWYDTPVYNGKYTIPAYGLGSVCVPLDMTSFGGGFVNRIDVAVAIQGGIKSFIRVKVKNENGDIERILFEQVQFGFGEIVSGIQDFKREPIAQVWYLCAEQIILHSPSGQVVQWSIRFTYGAPSNNDCSAAKVIVKDTEYRGLTDFATGTGSSECLRTNAYDGNDVWFKYIPEASGMATITTQGSSFDTTLVVYDGCGGNELACNDDAYGTLQSEITMYVEQGQNYFIRLAGWSGDVGDYVIKLEQIDCVMPSPAINPVPADGQGHVAVDGLTLAWNVDLTVGEMETKVEAVETTAGPDSQTTIYGSDNRKDYYQVTDFSQRLSMPSVAAIMNKADLYDNQDGTFALPIETLDQWYVNTDPLGTGHYLCSTEPFRNQPNPAIGSCFLVANDIIATSSQCAHMLDLEDMAFVFGFVMEDASTPVTTVESSEVYYADEIIASQSGVPDWALIKLDRPVTGYMPLRIRRDGKVSDEQQLYTVGYPLGLPKKLTDGGVVKSNTSPSFFKTNLDSYTRSSGSPVFNINTKVVEGILSHDANDANDFVAESDCDHSINCPDGGCPGWEIVTRTTEFASLVPLSAEKYDIYLDTENPPQDLLWADNPGNVYTFTSSDILDPYITYYWQVVSKNQCGDVPSAVWSFSTTEFAADYNGDGAVDSNDLSVLALKWLECDESIKLINNGDCVINFLDFSALANDWTEEGEPEPNDMVWQSINDPGIGGGHEGFIGQMSKHEITNAQYCEFLNEALASGDVVVNGDYVYGANGSDIGADFVGQRYYGLAGGGFSYNGAVNGGASRINYSGSAFTVDSGFEDHAVTYISWYGAKAFCNYYDYQLPTQWQWQAVADYDGSFNYGCGNTITNVIANYYNSNHPDGTTAVGAFGAYGYEMCDMTGNVWEWTDSLSSGSYILKGGSWDNSSYYCPVDYQHSKTPASVSCDIGFRVCR